MALASKATFAGAPLTGVWPEHCPNGHALAWAEMPAGEEPYLICPETSCEYASYADGATWRQWHEIMASIVARRWRPQSRR